MVGVEGMVPTVGEKQSAGSQGAREAVAPARARMFDAELEERAAGPELHG